MLPIYISYFAGEESDDRLKRKRQVITNSLGFVLGFTIVFLLLGAAAGTFGMFLYQNATVFNIIFGLIMILFGLNYMGAFKIGFLNRTKRFKMKVKALGFLKSVLFGIIFSVGWTPCVGAFLGSALMLAANAQEASKGIVMLLLYSLGLGIPFVVSAILIDSLKKTFDAIKRHFRVISIISGSILVLVGILMMFGQLNAFLSLLTFR